MLFRSKNFYYEILLLLLYCGIIVEKRKVKDMNSYFENLNETIKQYFNILSDEIPEFLYEYIDTQEMQRIGKISMACGTDYTKLYNHKFFYSNLEHSIGVALIIWHFTKDKKQTLAGLFHDIATPVFKHCIDFMNGDHEKQESTEELTTQIISNSKEVMKLLNKDGIKLEEVDNYHLYPIADNDTPQLSADRLEYTLITGIYFNSENIWDLKQVREFYNNLTILKNEDGVDELGFKNKEIAEKYIEYAKKIWPFWITNEDKITMQFIADIVKRMSEKKLITQKDLYTLSEKQIIDKIEKCEEDNISKCFKIFRETTQIGESDELIKDKYCISIKGKRRYVIPLVKTENGNKRINEISEMAKTNIDNYLKYQTKKYAYLNFNF